MTLKIKTGMTVIATLALAATGMTSAAPVAHADDIRQYQVDFTNGIGVRLRTAPYVGAPGLGADGKMAIPEKAWFPAECEDYGDWVTNVNGESTNVYMRAPGGVWVSTAWLNTGTNGRVGLPLCSEKDAALSASVQAKSVSAHHREGQDVVMVTNAEGTSGRVYFSKSATKEAAEALNSAGGWLDVGEALFCATAGLLVGVSTGGTGLVAGSVGFVGDLGCSALAGVASPAGFELARGAANAASSAAKCYEVRMHTDLAGDWVPDVWTVTDHQDYCG